MFAVFKTVQYLELGRSDNPITYILHRKKKVFRNTSAQHFGNQKYDNVLENQL